MPRGVLVIACIRRLLEIYHIPNEVKFHKALSDD
jgi:hypothetical protein